MFLGCKRKCNGYTLVELVVVMSIVSIMAAIVVPRFASSDVFETRGDAGLLSHTLRYAQKTAIAQRRVVYVVYNATVPPSVNLCFSSDCSQTVVSPENNNPYSFVFSRQVQVNAASFAFDSLGRPIPNLNTAVVLTNSKNNTQSVTVNIEADTGYIR
jgi:MSHA pilin protein MshC